MSRLVTALYVMLDALPFAAGLGAATFVGASSSLAPGQAVVIAAAVSVAILLSLGTVGYVTYRGADERFWVVRSAVRAVAFSAP